MRPLLARFALFIALWTIPLSSLAADMRVRDLQAEERNGQIHVRWMQPESGEAAYYHVYFSRRSLIAHNGEYDDYEKTSGKRTDFILIDFPRDTGELYLAVLAVDANGKELSSFTNEVRVALPGGVPAPTEIPSSAPAVPPTPASLELLAARPLSPQSIVLAFNLPMTLSAANAPNAFRVVDDTGAVIALRRIELEGMQVRLETTSPLRAGTAYRVEAAPVLLGIDGQNRVPLSSERNIATFAMDGQAPAPAPAEPESPSPLPQENIAPVDVQNLTMQSTQQQSGRSTVLASWTTVGTPHAYSIRQTRDGRTFGDPLTLPGTASQVRFHDVEPGNFGMLIQAVSASGQTSRGAFAWAVVAGTAHVNGRLNASGAGVIGVMVLSGSIAGWVRSKRRKNA